MLLRKLGVESDIAVNGQFAVDYVREQGDSYDMIFMDFMMPVMVS
jgi:CheY-like chemotaxis protein